MPSSAVTVEVGGARGGNRVVVAAAGGEEKTASAGGATEMEAVAAGAPRGSVQPVASRRDRELTLASPVSASADGGREVAAWRLVVGDASTRAASVGEEGRVSSEAGLEIVA